MLTARLKLRVLRRVLSRPTARLNFFAEWGGEFNQALSTPGTHVPD